LAQFLQTRWEQDSVQTIVLGNVSDFELGIPRNRLTAVALSLLPPNGFIALSIYYLIQSILFSIIVLSISQPRIIVYSSTTLTKKFKHTHLALHIYYRLKEIGTALFRQNELKVDSRELIRSKKEKTGKKNTPIFLLEETTKKKR